MIDGYKMPDEYLSHQVFKNLEYMIGFYDSLSMNCYGFVASGTHGLANYASYVYLSIEGTLESISVLLKNGRINDACSLVRKYYDDILLDIYIDVTLKDKFDFEKNFIVQEVDEWIKGRLRIPNVDKILDCIKHSERTKDLFPFFGWKTYLKKNREIFDDSVHSNRFHLMLANCNTVYNENRERYLKNCEMMLDQLFLIHLAFIFHLNPHNLMASSYIDYMEMGQTPPVGSENWIAPFAQDAFDRIIKPHTKIADFIKSSCRLSIE